MPKIISWPPDLGLLMYCLSLRSLASFPLKLLYFCLKWMCCSRWDLQSLVKTTIPSILETVLLLIEQLKMVLTSALNLDTNISSFSFTLKVKLYFFLFCDSLSTNWRTTVFLSLPSGSPPIASLLTYQQQGFPHKTLVLPAKTVMLGDSFLHLHVSLMCLCEPTHVCYISCSVLSKLSAAVSSSCLYIYHNKHLILWDPWSLPSYQIVPKVSFGDIKIIHCFWSTLLNFSLRSGQPRLLGAVVQPTTLARSETQCWILCVYGLQVHSRVFHSWRTFLSHALLHQHQQLGLNLRCVW